MDSLTNLFNETLSFASGPAFAVAIIALMWGGDGALSVEARDALSRWLRRQPLVGHDELLSSSQYFVGLFDQIFGEHHLTGRCFRRSCFASVVAVALMTILWIQFDQVGYEFVQANPILWLGIIVLGVVLNFIPDYVSLLETRYALSLLARLRHRPIAVVVILAADLLASALVFFIIGTIMLAIYSTLLTAGKSISDLLEYGSTNFSNYVYWFKESFDGAILSLHSWGFSLSTPPHPLARAGGVTGVYFYSTFFTSVWLWLFTVSHLAIRLLAFLGPVIKSMQFLLPLEEKPVRCIGLVAGLIVCLIVWFFVALIGEGRVPAI